MKEIKMLVEYIHEELDDAEKYAKKAAYYKSENRNMSELFLQLSKEEMGHMERLHDQVVKCINKQRDENGAPPASMMAIWEWEHEKIIAHAEKVKHLQEMAR